MRCLRLLPCVLLALLAAPPAHAIIRLPAVPRQVSHNPAEALAGEPIEEPVFDPATHCSRAPRPGMVALERWLELNVRGTSWGTFRCEKWGKREASLHSEGRAIDWHLDATRAADRRQVERLVTLLLAPDSGGNQQALARRMGVEEIIWDCGYWGAGRTEFTEYRPCFNKHGTRRRHVDPTLAHRNHVHIGLTRAGAAKRTSFWKHGGT
jgi:hypothetical protein